MKHIKFLAIAFVAMLTLASCDADTRRTYLYSYE